MIEGRLDIGHERKIFSVEVPQGLVVDLALCGLACIDALATPSLADEVEQYM